jgi:hypothetical protein
VADCCNLDSKNPRDLTTSRAAWFFWYGPVAVILAGSFWGAGRNWLWASAFAVMGIGCLSMPAAAIGFIAISLALCFLPPLDMQ